MRTDLFSLILLLSASTMGAWISANQRAFTKGEVEQETSLEVVVDASGHTTPARDYRRIVCASSIAAAVVPELVNTNRIVMTTTWFAENHAKAYRLDHLASVNSLHGVESMMAVNPDLIIVHSMNHKNERVARLRETGVAVLDLGSMLGWQTLSRDILKLGQVLRQPERAKQLAQQLQRRLQQTALHVPREQRRSAMWLGVYGDKLSGGTLGSSYHDMLRFAGLRDIVAGSVDSPWPSFSVEEALAYDPDVIVTGGSSGSMAASLRAMPGLKEMRAIKANNIITMPNNTDSTGPGLLEAAEFLCTAVYGPAPTVEKADWPTATTLAKP